MSINFPNDPSTDPGDGGQWTDDDGNLWQVELVAGEAVWTMIQAADTGGGGGGAACWAECGRDFSGFFRRFRGGDRRDTGGAIAGANPRRCL